jgi:peroxin-19
MKRYSLETLMQYPKWLETNKATLSSKDYETYSKQYEYVQKIMAKFDDPKYDEDKQSKADLMDMMQKMQELGPPPKDILSELAPGMEIDSEGLPTAPENCGVM